MNLPKVPDPETPAQGTNEPGRLSDSQESDIFEVVFADPWLKKTERTAGLPNDVRFVCTYEANIVVDLVDFSLFLRRTETTDELWLDTGYNVGRVCTISRKDKELTACLKLMELYFRAVHCFQCQEKFTAAGIVDKSAYDRLLKRLEDVYEENRRKARERETEIIKVARELGLSPRPTGESPDFWVTSCPGGNHPLYFNAALNSFGCGHCEREDGVEGLREFVKKRKAGKQRGG